MKLVHVLGILVLVASVPQSYGTAVSGQSRDPSELGFLLDHENVIRTLGLVKAAIFSDDFKGKLREEVKRFSAEVRTFVEHIIRIAGNVVGHINDEVSPAAILNSTRVPFHVAGFFLLRR
ncbi:hypothetical protein HDE_04835 [Halotydeus destructor]|nr:hypothetical protein HDE_04835 [Halotydeus destructor]